MLVLCWPLLNYWGYVITPKEAVVMCWSGLRGAVGLSLALFILLDDQIADRRFRTLTFFHMGCVAFLTIILQGTSMKPLLQVSQQATSWRSCSLFVFCATSVCAGMLQCMQMTRTPTVKRNFLSLVVRQAEEHSEQQLRLAKYDRILGDPDWQAIARRADLESHSLLRRHSSKLGSMRASSANIGGRLWTLGPISHEFFQVALSAIRHTIRPQASVPAVLSKSVSSSAAFGNGTAIRMWPIAT